VDDEVELSTPDSHVCLAYHPASLLTDFSGHCIVGDDGHSLIVSNLRDGIDLYSLPSSQPLLTFKHNIICNVPLLVSSACDGRMSIVGGDNGCTRMYDPCMGMMTGVLQHRNSESFPQKVLISLIVHLAGTLVQAVDVGCSLALALEPNTDF